MISSEQILTSLVNKINRDPMNPKKFYFIFKEIVEIDKSIILEIKFGVSENQSYTFKKYVKNETEKNQDKEELFYMSITKIFDIVYDVIDNKYTTL